MLLNKIRDKGLLWFFNRLRIEVRNPSKRFSQVIINSVLTFRKKIFKSFNQEIDDHLLYFIYDLAVCDLTYAFAILLVDAEFEARKKGKEGFVVVIVPCSPSPLPKISFVEYDSVIDDQSKLWRFHNIIMPLISLSPFCRGIYILPKRNNILEFVKNHDVYPYLYDGFNLRASSVAEFMYKKLYQPNLVEGLRALPQGIKYVQDWLQVNLVTKAVVTITLRSSPFDTHRNSNIDAWSKFSNYLLENGFHPVIIPDTDNAFIQDSVFTGASVFRECSWNLGLRAAIYEIAYLNFFVPNGCATLPIFNPCCSYICMNMLPTGSIVTTEKAYEAVGHKIGEDYKFATSQQRLCWKPDSFANIKDEFDRFVSENPFQQSV